MKLSQLLEGPPDYLDKEMPVVSIKSINFYSEDTVKREFELMAKIEKGADTYWAIIKKNKSFAVIGKLSKREQDGATGIELVGKLEFKDSPDFSYSEMIETPAHVLQVDSVVVLESERFNGVGADLYKAIAKYGYVLVSDHTQYRGGRRLWQKIIKMSKADGLEIFVVDNGKPLSDEDGNPIVYDGNNIPAEKIWGAPTDDMSKSKFFTLLVLRNKK